MSLFLSRQWVLNTLVALTTTSLLASGLASSLALQAVSAPVTAAPALGGKPTQAKPVTTAKTVAPLDLLKKPEAYLNQRIYLEGEFRTFSTLGLDYKPAFRDSKDYVSLLIRRPDVSHHKIPLSEVKLFYPRQNASLKPVGKEKPAPKVVAQNEVLSKLEPGDWIGLEGTVFSTALGDPWVDVTTVTRLKPVATPEPGHH